jgi:hypothetical protein
MRLFHTFSDRILVVTDRLPAAVNMGLIIQRRSISHYDKYQ